MSGSDRGGDLQATAAGRGLVGRVDRLEEQAAAKDGELEERFEQLATQLDTAHRAAMESIALLAGKVVARLDDQLATAEAAHIGRHEELALRIEATLEKRQEQLSAMIDAVQASIMDVVSELDARLADAEASAAVARGAAATLSVAGAHTREEAVEQAVAVPKPYARAVDADPGEGRTVGARAPDEELAGGGVDHRDPAPTEAGNPNEELADASVGALVRREGSLEGESPG